MNTYTAEVVPVVLEKHENADKLSVVRVKGWQVCTETTQWKEGQLGCYITPDTLVPISNPLFSFLVKDAKDFGTADLPKMMTRIKARRLRGVVSYGLLVPAPPGFKEGDDLFNVLGLEHYDPETTRTVKEKSSNRIKLGGETESPPNLPILPPYYDIENIQNRPNWFQEEEEVLLTEKIDGSNMIVVWWEGRFWVKSRKEWKREYPSYAHLTEEKLTEQGCAPEKAKQIMERLRDRPKEQSEFWKAFRRVEDVVGKYCKDNPGHCVVGEMYGSNGKIRYCSPCTFRAFDIMRWDEWVDPFEAREVLGEDLMWAPLVAKMPYNLEKILSLSEGMSLVNPEVIREGVVVNPLKERRTNRGERIKLKAVSPVYLERF